MRRVMVGGGWGAAAAAIAMASMQVAEPIRPHRALRQERPVDETRQRKRWLERQARKQQRKHRK